MITGNREAAESYSAGDIYMKLSKSDCAKLGSNRSREVSAAKRYYNIQEYNNNPILCKQCNIPLDYDHKLNKFCSQTCAAIYNNSHKPKKQPTKRIYIPRSHEDRLHRNIVSQSRNESKRQYLLSSIGNTCKICGFSNRLIIHKKDGIRHKDFREMSWEEIRSVPTNEFVTVCHKCHSHIHWCMKYLHLSYENIIILMGDDNGKDEETSD